MRASTKLSLMGAMMVLSVAGMAGIAAAATARGPIWTTTSHVNSTTYYSCSGSSHTALDISNGTCSTWNHRGMLIGTYHYTQYGGCPNSCGACSSTTCCNGGAGNYFVVTGSNGWDFRQLHSNSPNGSQTCDRCALALIGSTGHTTGAHSHSDNRQYGTRKSAWYTSVGTTCGTRASGDDRVGVPTL